MKYEALYSKGYKDRLHLPVIALRDVVYERQDLVDKLGIIHSNAAVRINNVFDALNIDTIEKILAIPMMDLARIKGVGETALRVIVEVLIDQKVPEHRIDKWVHGAMDADELVQWTTIVRRAAAKGRRRSHKV